MPPLIVLSHLLAALAYLLVAGLVLVRWHYCRHRAWVVLACLLTAAWAVYLAFLYWQGDTPTIISAGPFEIGRNAGWYALLLAYLADNGRLSSNSNATHVHDDVRILKRWVAFAVSLLVVALPLLLIPTTWAQAALWHSVAILAMAVFGLVLVEQVWRNTPPQHRWQIKLLCLVLGGIFAFDLFLFADLALFTNRHGTIWEGRGMVAVIVSPLLALAFSRHLGQHNHVQVSRHLLFHTTALLGVGTYLLAVGGTSYLLHQFDGEIVPILQVSFLFGAVLVLALVLFSDSIRAKLRVFLSKHFFRYKYDYRHEWLHFTGMLSYDNPSMPFHERCIYAITELTDNSGGLLWLRDDDSGFRFEGGLNLDTPVGTREDRNSSLVCFLESTKWIIGMEEYHQNPALYGNLILPQWLTQDPRYWAVVPLLKGEVLEGFVVLAQPRAQHRLDWETRDLLKTAGRQLAVYVALVRTQNALLEARQFEAFHRLAAYLAHDLKNVSAQLALVCSNAKEHSNNPAFIDDAFQTVAHALVRLERTQGHLRSVQPQTEAITLRLFDLADLLAEVVGESRGQRPLPTIDVPQPVEMTSDREGLKNALQHLVRNAQQATADTGWVRIVVTTDDDWIQFSIEDNGSGIDEDFLRRRLFRPFQTTKGNAGMGIGLYEAKDWVTRMGGRIDVTSEIGKGTLVTLSLPR
jgi:putative PEP-CTERM system histidine kinase